VPIKKESDFLDNQLAANQNKYPVQHVPASYRVPSASKPLI
jgi:hypothetical protein